MIPEVQKLIEVILSASESWNFPMTDAEKNSFIREVMSKAKTINKLPQYQTAVLGQRLRGWNEHWFGKSKKAAKKKK